ncbi:MAG: hypothetical protein NVS3B19_04300 [Ginsengibacter sp.]
MLTRAEERFITNWLEQKEGPKWKFYVQYTIAWGIVFFLCLFFILKMFVDNINLGEIKYFLIILPSSFVLSLIVTHLIYAVNENKLRKLREKEKIT